VVGLLLELGEVTGRDHRVGAHQRRRSDLLVEVHVAVERQLAQRPHQRGAGAAVHDEHRARQLDGPFHVEDAELLADLPVGHALVIGVAVGVEAFDPDHDVVVLAEAVGRVGRREVRNAQQLLAQLGGHLVRADVERLLLGAEDAALLLQFGGLVLALLAEQLADFVGQRADLGAEPVATRGQVAKLGVEADDLVDGARVLATAGEPDADRVGVVAEQAHVEHPRTVAAPASRPRTRWCPWLGCRHG